MKSKEKKKKIEENEEAEEDQRKQDRNYSKVKEIFPVLRWT